MSQDDAHFRLRLPVKLRDQLRKLAQENARSINAEILYRLERSVRLSETPEETIQRHIERVEGQLRKIEEQKPELEAELRYLKVQLKDSTDI